MALFRKKADPIAVRSDALNSQISALEAQIRQLNTKIERAKSHPRVRSTAVPQGPTVISGPAPAPREPVFEQLNYQKAQDTQEIESSPDRYNDLGVRKYDIIGAFRRLYNNMRGTPTANPKLVSYLAAGSIKGLRPLRYEKRIARNRFIFLSIFFVLVLLGIVSVVFGNS